jgi:hypothetical protein
MCLHTLFRRLGLFVICGIGADDIFVFVDAWRQSAVLLPHSTPLANRISWTHKRAAGAMFITSCTTAGAFLSNAVSEVIPVCLFGERHIPYSAVAQILRVASRIDSVYSSHALTVSPFLSLHQVVSCACSL